MDILTVLQQDYARFPLDQSYQIYAEDVYFQDPLTRFRGLDHYRQTIEFIRKWFHDPHLELHAIDRVVGGASEHENRLITTRWTLSWNTPLPWRPRIEISGHSEMLVNDSELIISHIDYWDRSPLHVLGQHFRF